METSQVKPRKNDSEKTKERLLKAAMDVFAAKGYAGATTREIAKKADVNVALISRYFQGKEELFTTLVKHQLDELVDFDLKDGRPVCQRGSDEFKESFKQLLEGVKVKEKFLKIILLQALTEPKYAKLLEQTKVVSDDPDMIARFNEISQSGGLNKSFKHEEFCHQIRPYIIGQVVFSRLIMRKSYESIQEEMEKFIDTLKPLIDAAKA